jgi:Mn-dependent DtxR family transcriptional regulator
VLYGNIESFLIDHDAITLMAGILGAIVLGLLLFYRPLLVSTFDPALAVSLGIPATAVHYMLMAVLSLTIVASFEAVGAILAVALLVLPGATARLWTDRMPPMLLFAAGHGMVSTLLGYWLSHPAVMNTSASGAICLAGFLLFMASWLLAPRHGLLHRARVRRRLVRTTAMENLLKAIEELSAANPSAPVPVTRVASDLRVSPRALAATLASAIRRGWVVQNAEATLALTASGRAQSERLVRAHELWERYLRQEVGLEADHVHDAAEWVEHFLSEDKMIELDELLAKSQL